MSDSPKVDETPKPFYKHVIRGKCTVHGEVWLECVHPKPDSTEAELLVSCLKCTYERTQEANK